MKTLIDADYRKLVLINVTKSLNKKFIENTCTEIHVVIFLDKLPFPS